MSADGSNQLTIHGKRRELADDDIREESPVRRPRLDGDSSRMGNDYKDNTGRDNSRNVFGNYTNTNNMHYIYNVAYHRAETQEDAPVTKFVKSLGFETMDYRYNSISVAHSQTCQWFFEREEYNAWRDPANLRSHHGFFWIKGKLGAGKSAFMKAAVRHAKKHFDDITIYFFFNCRGAPLETSTEGMYRSLLRQLLEKLPQLIHAMPRPEAPPFWSVELLEDLFREAVRALGSAKVTCYVDAVDECREQEARRMMEFFDTLGELSIEAGVVFRVMFSSRHNSHLVTGKRQQIVLEEQDEHAADISTFIHTRLQLGKSTLASEIENEINKRAQGIFRWVVLVIRALNKDSNRGRTMELRQHLDALPEEMVSYFEDSLCRFKHDERSLLIFKWVLHARQPLRLEELYCAANTSAVDDIELWNEDVVSFGYMERFVVGLSKGLVEMPKRKERIAQFIHPSVKRFFEDRGLVLLDPSLWDDSNNVRCHDQLKQCCLNYLIKCGPVLLSSRTDGLKEHLSSLPDETNAIRNRTVTRHPFLEYALRGILFHADSAHSKNLSQHNFITTFPRRLWQRLYNLTVKHHEERLSQNTPIIYIFVLMGARNLAEQAMTNLEMPVYEDTPDEQYGSLLGIAIELNDDRMFTMLLAQGANPHSSVKGGQSCLYSAIKKGNAPMVRSLLGAGATVKGYESTESDIHMALQQGNVEIVQMMLANKVVRAQLREHALDAVTDACIGGHEEVLRLLLEENVDPGPALIHAARSGRDEVVKLLLTCEIDINIEDQDSGTALRIASSEQHANIVRMLLNGGAAVNIRGTDGKTALYVAVEQGCVEIVQLLLDSGADANVCDDQSMTALMIASRGGYDDVVRLLLDHEAKVDLRSAFGWTALHHAVMNDHKKNMRMLEVLGHGTVQTCAGPSQSRGALSLESQNAYLSVVKLLLERGAKVSLVFRPSNYLVNSMPEVCNEIERVLLKSGATLVDLC